MMNRISRFINKEKLSKTRAWANEHALIRYVLVFLTIAYVLATYKTQFMAWYDNNIMPIQSKNNDTEKVFGSIVIDYSL